MKRAAIVVAAAGAVGLGAIAAPAPAEARPFHTFGPALVANEFAAEIFAPPAYAYAAYPYGVYDGGYAPAYDEEYVPTYSYGYDVVAPDAWGEGYATTTDYGDETPAYYSYESVGSPIYLSTRMPHAGLHHRLHRR